MTSRSAPVVASIVEGYGEVDAVPVLLRRIAAAVMPGGWADIRPPFRVGRNSVVKDHSLERTLRQVLATNSPCDSVLILLDADDDCPVELGPTLQERALRVVGSRVRVSVVLANREYESWFLASAESLAGFRGLPTGTRTPSDSETLRDAKGWLSGKLGTAPYRPNQQAGFTARFDMELARRNSRSFQKLWNEVHYLLTGERDRQEE